MNNEYLLTENMVNTIALYTILKKMMLPFEEWDAYKLGIIDKDGKKLKEPVKAKELEAWDMLTKFVWNFKKVLIKFIGKSKLSTYLTAAYLLRDSISYFYLKHNQLKLNENLLKDFSYSKQNAIYDLIIFLPKFSLNERVTEDNFEYYMVLYTPKIEKFLEENKSFLNLELL